MQKHILVVDDDMDVRLSAVLLLESLNYRVSEADSPEAAKPEVQEGDVDLLLLDMNFSKDTTSGKEGLAFLEFCQEQLPELPIIAMTAWAKLDVAIPAMQKGARDFIEKPWDNNRLLQVIKQQLNIVKLSRENKALRQQSLSVQTANNILFRSDVMGNLMEELKMIARSDASVLLTGENGTGKSSLARLVHQYSSRAENSFVSVNMGAISDNLFESEMFGHQKGAFTGATENRIGRFEMADSGSLFLDEITTIPDRLQPKLLRVIESGEFEVVGRSRTKVCDVRLISATNENLKEVVEQNQFREDLFYRLNTFTIHIPSLKERKDDIALLADHYLNKFAKKYKQSELRLSDSAVKALQSYSWPGNIRELSHTMERAALLSKSSVVETQQLNISASNQTANTKFNSTAMTLEESEVGLIRRALNRHDNNVKQAAEDLGITASSLYRRLEKYQIHV